MARAGSRSRGSTRERMIDSAVVLLRERGPAGTTLDAVLAHSGAPRGSVYHHFPGGRRELVDAALTREGELVSALIAHMSSDDGPRGVLERFAQLWRAELVASDYRAGCPVLALVVTDDPSDPGVTALAHTVLVRWRRELALVLAAHGVPPVRAEPLAVLTLAAVEGAVALCRSERSASPLDMVVAELAPLLGGTPVP